MNIKAFIFALVSYTYAYGMFTNTGFTIPLPKKVPVTLAINVPTENFVRAAALLGVGTGLYLIGSNIRKALEQNKLSKKWLHAACAPGASIGLMIAAASFYVLLNTPTFIAWATQSNSTQVPISIIA